MAVSAHQFKEGGRTAWTLVATLYDGLAAACAMRVLPTIDQHSNDCYSDGCISQRSIIIESSIDALMMGNILLFETAIVSRKNWWIEKMTRRWRQ